MGGGPGGRFARTETEFLDVSGTKVLRVTFTNGFYSAPPPSPASGLKLVCNETLSLRTLKIMPRYLNEIVRSGIQLPCFETEAKRNSRNTLRILKRFLRFSSLADLVG